MPTIAPDVAASMRRTQVGRRRLASVLVAALALLLLGVSSASARDLRHHDLSGAPAAVNLGPNVIVFNPSMTPAEIKAKVDAIANQQVPNQFGTQRYELLFEPGTYGSATDPLNFQVGYYESVAGLGASPKDVVINGSIDSYNQCDSNGCTALDNFWRSMSNITINVTNPNGCYTGEFWAVSQAAPLRRVLINGNGENTTLMDYCTGPSYASGGFIADSQFTGAVINGSQQQWFTRNSSLLGGWTNGVWNQVFSGVSGAPATCFPSNSSCGGPYTTLPTSRVTREAPYLYTDANGNYRVFVPSAQQNTSGTSWANGATPGTSVPIDSFYIATPADSAWMINRALARGMNLMFTPGVYQLNRTLLVRRPGTVVLGLGFATLVPTNGNKTMQIANVPDVSVSGLIFDAGSVNSRVLLQVGSGEDNGTDHAWSGIGASNPTTLSDVFFRIGGATPGSATDSLVVNSNNVILDDIWAWRADHGNGVGWTKNTADTGLIVNGNNVTAYGLAVEHYQKYQVIWNGKNGEDVFFQSEMPYDPPSQSAWMEAPGVNGYAAFKVTNDATGFKGYGMGVYSYFDQGVDIHAASAIEVPSTLPAGSITDALTVFLNGSGGIDNVINNTGGSATAANPSTAVTVVSYP